MTESNFWIENYVSYSSARSAGVHQANKEFEIEVSDSVDFNPSIEVSVTRSQKISIQVPKSSKYHNVSLYIYHAIGLTDCSIDVSHTFGRRPGIRRNYVSVPENVFRQVFNLILEFCPLRALILCLHCPLVDRHGRLPGHAAGGEGFKENCVRIGVIFVTCRP